MLLCLVTLPVIFTLTNGAMRCDAVLLGESVPQMKEALSLDVREVEVTQDDNGRHSSLGKNSINMRQAMRCDAMQHNPIYVVDWWIFGLQSYRSIMTLPISVYLYLYVCLSVCLSWQ